MSIEQSTSFTKIVGSRKVCVINLHDQPYVEEFKGEVITIPPLGKRSIFMPFWKASKFKSSCIAPPAYDITGEIIRGGKVKMIQVVELNDEEREKLGELSPEQLAKKQSVEDGKKNLTCGSCGFESKSVSGLRLHMRAHPEVVAVE